MDPPPPRPKPAKKCRPRKVKFVDAHDSDADSEEPTEKNRMDVKHRQPEDNALRVRKMENPICVHC